MAAFLGTAILRHVNVDEQAILITIGQDFKDLLYLSARGTLVPQLIS